MSSNDTNERKRKSPIIPETVSSNGGLNPNEESNKARRVSTNALTSTDASLKVETLEATEDAISVNSASAAATKQEELMESNGQIIQDLFRSDDAKVSDTLNALSLEFVKDNCESLVAAGICLAFVRLIKERLKKMRKKVPGHDLVTEVNESPELETILKTLGVIVTLVCTHKESRVGISSVGGVKAVVKVMKMFPKCRALQVCACGTLRNLTYDCNLGKKKAIESGGLQVLVAAINNHLDSILVCYYGCIALFDIIEKASKENTRLLISLGGATAVAKLREKWPDDNDIQTSVRSLAKLIGTEMKSWAAMPVETPEAAEKVTAANTASAALASTASAALASTASAVVGNTASAVVGNTASAAAVNTVSSATKNEDSIEIIGQMIQDLFPFGNAKVNTTLDALNLDLIGNKNKCEKIQVVGGCLALVLLLKKCLDEVIGIFDVGGQVTGVNKHAGVTEVNEVAELTTLHKALHVMIRMSHHLDESKVGIAAIGGVEAVVKAMNTFPKCQALQEFASILLLNLACYSVGKKRVVETGDMEALLAAIKNHLNSDNLCKYACNALCNIIQKENTRLLISLGGATAVANISKKWPGGGAWVKLAKLIGTEMISWAEHHELEIDEIE